jgi:two-component system, sensor histidine kinase SagS
MNSSEREKNHRILVVDDESDVLEYLKLHLESLGWQVTAVASVSQALRELERSLYFLVLTDIAMPDMDGYEFISLIKQKQIVSQVALMTGFGYNPRHTLIKINKELRYPCLFKPFDRTKVADTVLKAWQEYNREMLGPDAASDPSNAESQPNPGDAPR